MTSSVLSQAALAVMYLAYIDVVNKKNTPVSKQVLQMIGAVVIATVSCIALDREFITGFGVIATWSLAVFANEDRENMSVRAWVMVLVTAICIIEICIENRGAVNWVTCLIFGVMVLCNALGKLGIADTMTYIIAVSIIGGTMDIIAVPIMVLISNVGLAMEMLIAGRKKKKKSAPYIPWLLVGLLAVEVLYM